MTTKRFAAEFLLAQFLSLDRMAAMAGVAPVLDRCASGHAIVSPDCPACQADMNKLLDRVTGEPCGWCHRSECRPGTGEHCSRCQTVGSKGLLACDCGAAADPDQ